MNVTHKAVILSIFLACFLASCAGNTSLPQNSPVVTGTQPESMQSPTPADTFLVDIWVDKPEPSAGDLVVLVGTVTRNGVSLSGTMMQASWPNPDEPDSMVECRVLMTYARGICVIEASKYPAGQYVPIKVVFDYRGTEILGETGFTRK